MADLTKLSSELADPDSGGKFKLLTWIRTVNAILRALIRGENIAGDRKSVLVDRRSGQVHIHGKRQTFRGGGFVAPFLPFQLVPASKVADKLPKDTQIEPYHFCVFPGKIAARFHKDGHQETPLYDGTSLDDYPLIIAPDAKSGVYARVELTYDENLQRQIVGDWTIELSEDPPDETNLETDGETTTNGIYYREIGTAFWNTETNSMALEQTSFGPWTAAWDSATGTFFVIPPNWALTTIEEQA